MNKRGIAKGKFRADGGNVWSGRKKAETARNNMIDRENSGKEKPKTAKDARKAMIERQEAGTPESLTNSVVNDYMGGSDAAAKQSKAYQGVIDSIKAGKTAHEKGSLADAARNRMIERDAEGHPDIGRDRGKRKAYPAE